MKRIISYITEFIVIFEPFNIGPLSKVTQLGVISSTATIHGLTLFIQSHILSFSADSIMFIIARFFSGSCDKCSTELFEIELCFDVKTVLMLNWIVWKRAVYMHKNGFGINNLQWLMYHKTKQNQAKPNYCSESLLTNSHKYCIWEVDYIWAEWGVSGIVMVSKLD